MTNRANYKRGKLHHSPWHGDICTSNLLNTPPERLSRSFRTTNSNQRRRGANRTTWISSKQMCPIDLLSDCLPDAISRSISDNISVTIAETISDSSNDSNHEAMPNDIPESNSDHSHCSTLLEEGGLWQWLCEALGEHLRSRYVAHVDPSVSSHICSQIVLGRNVCNCSSAVDSVLDARNQWLWMGENVRDSREAELVQEMRDLCESHASYSKGIVFGISCRLGSWLLFSRSPINRSLEGDDQSTWKYIAIRASCIVRVDITSKWAFSFECSSETRVASLSCHWDAKTRAWEPPYAHSSGRDCPGWELRWHMQYRAKCQSSRAWGYWSWIGIWSDL